MFRSFSILSASVVALAMSGSAKADDDVVRLNGKGDAEVTETRGYGGGGYRGGYGGGGHRGGYGGYGGYRGGYGGYGGYRSGYYGGGGYYGGYGRGYGGYYGRPNYGIGISLGYSGYYGGGYYGAGYGGYSSPSYYSQPYYSYSPAPCSCAAPIVGATTLTLSQPTVPIAPGDSTFPYDGGPRDGYLAPLPAGMQKAQPRDGMLVSVPSASSGYQFQAFGEKAAPRPATSNAAATLRVSYPAYGEPMPNFNTMSGGTTDYRVSLR